MLSVFILGMAFNAAAIKVFLAWQETSPDCISWVIIVTEDNGELLGMANGQTGPGCPRTFIETDPGSPNQIDDLMRDYPEIESAIEEAYQEYSDR